MVVLVVSVMWLAASTFLLYSPLVPESADLARVRGTVVLCTQLCSLLSLLVFGVGEVTANVSSVDRLWSLVPTLYTAVTWARHGGARLALMTLVTSIWSLRLTRTAAPPCLASLDASSTSSSASMRSTRLAASA